MFTFIYQDNKPVELIYKGNVFQKGNTLLLLEIIIKKQSFIKPPGFDTAGNTKQSERQLKQMVSCRPSIRKRQDLKFSHTKWELGSNEVIRDRIRSFYPFFSSCQSLSIRNNSFLSFSCKRCA